MAHEDDAAQPHDDAQSSQWIELQARVARLEDELAELQRHVGPPRSVTAPSPAPVAPPQSPMTVTQVERLIPPLGDMPPANASAPQTIFVRPPTQHSTRDSFEERLGSQIFNRIAILLLLIGTAYGLKLAVDRGLIGPMGRVLAGLLAGAGLVVWSERFRSKGFAAFSYSLKAVGSGVLYLTLWAAFQMFHLLSAPAALAMMVLVTAWNAYMAWAQNSELLAAYALAGGLATPLLVSTGGNHEIFLFIYLLAIDTATVALVRLKRWPRLLLGAFPATVLFFVGWYLEFYRASELYSTAIFVLLFGAVFACVTLRRTQTATQEEPHVSMHSVLTAILLPIANAAFVALALYAALEDAGHHALLPWLMVVLAAAYLLLMFAPQRKTASAIHLSLAVVFLTIAIPLKASGHWITVSWLVEGVALLWVAVRLQHAGSDEADRSLASHTLRPLGLASMLLGFCGVCYNLLDILGTSTLPFLNRGTGTALTGVAVFAGATWLALRAGGASRGTSTTQAALVDRRLRWENIAATTILLIAVTAILLAGRELLSAFDKTALHPPFQTPEFFTAIIALAILAAVVTVSLRIAKTHNDHDFWQTSAALSTIAFNLIAVLTGVCELSAIWNGTPATWSADAALRQALAISGFLMLYGAVLLGAGFWKRNAFLRWQALVLLVFTILKTFLYDMRNLSEGYRVVSVLGLGVLLMAISFAYQKDWLGLRADEVESEAAE